jgi:outer membrane protein, heavy metal efflux system
VAVQLLLPPVVLRASAGEPTRLALAQALSEARSQSPQIGVSQSQIDAARGMQTQAGLIPNPLFTLTSENTPLGGSAPFKPFKDTDDYAFVTQPIELGGKRRHRVDVAGEDVGRTRWEAEISLRQLEARVATAYWTAASAASVAELYHREFRALDELVAYNRARVSGGASAESDLVRIQLESTKLLIQANLASREARAGIISLYREIGQTGFPASVVFTDASDDLGEIRPPSVETVLARHPQMQLAREVVERANANLALQRANAVVDPSLILGYKRWSGMAPQNTGLNTLYFGVQVPLPLFSRNQGRVAAAEAELRGARAELRAQEIAIRAEVAAALDDYTTRREALLQLSPGMNDQAAETFSITERAYRLGGTDILRFLDAERVQIETAVLYQQVLTGYHKSAVNLKLATGMPQ